MSKIKKVFWLIGSNGNKVNEGACSLPTQLDILKHFLALQLNEKKTINDSAREFAEKVIVISEKINSECIEIHNIMKKIKILYTNYSLLKKAKSSTSKCQLEKRDNFLNSLSSCFFINYSLPKKIVCEKTKSNDRITNDSLNLEMPRLRNKIEGKEKYTLSDFEKGDASGDSSDPSYEPPIKLRKKIIRKSVLTTDLCLALDRTKVSKRNAAYIISSTCETPPSNDKKKKITWSASTIWRRRNEVRKEVANEVKKSFKPDFFLTVHWDGKKMSSTTNSDTKKAERLAILVSGGGISKLLGVPILDSGTGEAQANAVFEYIKDWNLSNRITAMCFDTTASNTGRENGACALLQKKLEKRLW